QRGDAALRVEVTEKEQPELFAFIRRVCRDTRAPFPHRVYLTHEVNAAVFFHESFLSLFFPTRKNLLIGLGLVNRLNLGEFKAVNFANSSLSRQMEFNADLVAVSVTGSDALIHGLARLDFASESLGQAWTDLTAAGHHGVYSRDLFFHQTRAADYLKAQR